MKSFKFKAKNPLPFSESGRVFVYRNLNIRNIISPSIAATGIKTNADLTSLILRACLLFFAIKSSITFCASKTISSCGAQSLLLFTLDDDSTFAIRPSGTEPKVKIYFGVNDKTYALALEKLAKFKESVTKIVVK